MRTQSARIALGFALIGLAWIYFSDRLFPIALSYQTLKGSGFVLVTSLFLYYRLAHLERAWSASQQELRAERDRRGRELDELSAVLEHSSDAILALDGEGRVIFRNRTADEMLGDQRQNWLEVLGRSPAELRELTLPGASGHLVPLEVHARTALLGGSPRTILTCQNLTERREAEALREKLESELRQAQKMEAVGQLAGGIAHDFNNLLTIVMGNCEALANSATLLEDDRVAVQEIMEASFRASELTRQLLLFSRRQVPRMTRLNLNSMVEDLLGTLGGALGSGLEVRLDAPYPLPPVQGDRGMLEQVLKNLVSNAGDAMPQGGLLAISLRQSGDWVHIVVEDHGEGIPPEQLPHIFEPFFTTKPIGKGTGLGLATAYGIVQQHGGSIDVESEPGKGTVFRIALPAEAAIEPVRPELTRPATGGEAILVVDDEPAIRRLVAHVLEASGYRVLQAASSQEALTLWEAEKARVGLLLTDVMMPVGLNGYELSARLLQQRPDLKVLHMSGFSPDVLENPHADPARFLSKPFRPSDLVRRVGEQLKR